MLEQLNQIRKLCISELGQIPSNSEEFFILIKKLSEHLANSGIDESIFLTELDALITSITTIMDFSRKLNLQLQLHSQKLLGLCKVFLDCSNTANDEKYTISTSGIEKPTNDYLFPAEEFDVKNDQLDDFEYPKLLLSKVYKEETIIDGVITHIKENEDLTFYIIDKSSEFRESIVDLSKTLDLRQYNDLPPANEIFGFVLEQHIFRAVRNAKIVYDIELENEICPVYLLDTGEIIYLKVSDDITYKLTNTQKKIPSLAIQCKLKCSKNNPFDNISVLKEMLKKFEHKNCRLKVLNTEKNTLYVELIDTCDSPIKSIDEHCFKKETALNNKITNAELDMLHEENFSTSNVMKAVMGHDPQDDKRICRFYNPKTGGCFKGSSCKLEHTLRQPEGWTKDTLPCSTIIENIHPIKVFTAGSIINITPTYIDRMDRFYAQINDPNEAGAPLVWNDDDIPSWKILRQPPHIFQLILSRYIDGLWYRAKVLSHDDDYKMFKVFYVDYGNHQVVNLNELASIDRRDAQLPFKAILCRIAIHDLSNMPTEDDEKGLQLICDMILNKAIDVRVESHYEDLFISFVNKIDYPLPDIFFRKGY